MPETVIIRKFEGFAGKVLAPAVAVVEVLFPFGKIDWIAVIRFSIALRKGPSAILSISNKNVCQGTSK